MRSSPDAVALLARPPATTRFVLWPLPDLCAVRSDALPAEVEAAASAEQQAYERGLADGSRHARDEHERALRALRENAAALARALHQARTAWLEGLEANLHALAVAAARHIIEREVTAAPEIVGELVRRALALVDVPDAITVRVNPADLPAVEALRHAPDDGGAPPAFAPVGDPAISRGGCVVETPGRLIDGRVETALLALYDRLRNG
jgi:flagellar biosynthesis/type III secretory pathway protein FliH